MQKKKYAFVADFDRTMTEEDFFKIVLDRHLSEEKKNYVLAMKENGIIGVGFLNAIFAELNMSEDELHDEILNTIILEEGAKDVIAEVEHTGGDFYILSAGCAYYIEKILSHHGITGIKVISNPGRYSNRGIEIVPNPDYPYYHKDYGIDKGIVIDQLHDQYEIVMFAGDSLPDLPAAEKADFVFARAALPKILEKEGIKYERFNAFGDIHPKNYL